VRCIWGNRSTTRRASVVSALACSLALLVSGCGGDTSITPPTAPPNDSAVRAQAAQEALDALAQGLESGVPAPEISSGKTPGLIPAVSANARALGVSGVAFDYVDSVDGALDASDQRRWGPGAWVGVVSAQYRLRADPGPTQMEIAVTFTRGSGAGDKPAQIAAIGGHGYRSALWLDGPATIRHQGQVWVIAAGTASPGHYPLYGATAVRQVRRVLPHWRGDLVLEIPQDTGQLDSVLNADATTYTDIAGVTTTADGSQAPRSPIHVFVNPAVFGTLKPRGAQVVLTHEATHVATRAPLTPMPTWLAEGFADYVALDHAGVPADVAAHQIIARVRAHGLPRRLPSSTDLAPTAPGLGATYEEAWTVCRYLGDAFGERRLVSFYDAVAGGARLADAFRGSFGVDQAQVVAGWRGWLADLAGVKP
jgi:hypothetical protein